MSRVVLRTGGGRITAAETHPTGARALHELHAALRAAEAEGVLDVSHVGPQLLLALDEVVPILRPVGEEERPEDNPAAPDEHRRNATWWRDKLGRAEVVLRDVADALGLPRASSYEWLPGEVRKLRPPDRRGAVAALNAAFEALGVRCRYETGDDADRVADTLTFLTGWRRTDGEGERGALYDAALDAACALWLVVRREGAGAPEPCCDGVGYCREHNPGGRLT